MKDKNVEAVRKKLRDRSRTGLRKYGVTTERTDLSLVDWLNHLQQELMDASVYIESAMAKLREGKVSVNPLYVPTPSQLALDAEVAQRKERKHA